MNWLIIHDWLAYQQHSNYIGSKLKENSKEPYYKIFKEISIGDKIVYYTRGSSTILGIYEVISNLIIKNDIHWGEVAVYKIEPYHLPPQKQVLNFIKLYKDDDVFFDFLPKVKRWGVYLLGRNCLKITDKDYNIIKKGLTNPEYLEYIEYVKKKPSSWHE